MKLLALLLMLAAVGANAGQGEMSLPVPAWEIGAVGLSTATRAVETFSGQGYIPSNSMRRIGYYYELDGTNDILNIQKSPLATCHTGGNWSIEFWAARNVAPGPGQEKYLMGNAIGLSDNGMLFDVYDTTATLLFYVMPNKVNVMNLGNLTATPQHIVVTMSSGGVCRGYRGGAFQQSVTISGGFPTSAGTYNYTIGAVNNSGYSSARITLLRFYRVELTPAEIRSLSSDYPPDFLEGR